VKLHPKIKNICEEFSNSYEWIENDESLFMKLPTKFVDSVRNRMLGFDLEYQDEQRIGQNSILWFRSIEDNEKSYDFEEDDE